MSRVLPWGYGSTTVGETEGFACVAAMEWLTTILREHACLGDWAASRQDSAPLTGRGPVYTIPAPVPGPDRCARWAVRHYHRGGVAARVLGDRYFGGGEARPIRELRASVEARTRGVRTPAAVAGAVYRVWPFYTADVLTELVPAGRSLMEMIYGQETPADACAALRLAGRLVRSLEDVGLLHRDLNAANVVLSEDSGTQSAWVVDLDGCRVRSASAPAHRGPMRRRLERSLRKLSDRHARPLSPAEWEALQTGFEEVA